jgi:hypothetical protein
MAEIFCLLKMIPIGTCVLHNFIPKIENSFYLDKRTKQFWTSGANDGASCNVQGVYMWCALSELVPPGLMSAFIKPTNSSSERCLLLDAAGADNSTTLAHSNCTQKMPYICEPNCKAPKCPSSECVKNVLNNAFYIYYFRLKMV